MIDLFASETELRRRLRMLEDHRIYPDMFVHIPGSDISGLFRVKEYHADRVSGEFIRNLTEQEIQDMDTNVIMVCKDSLRGRGL